MRQAVSNIYSPKFIVQNLSLRDKKAMKFFSFAKFRIFLSWGIFTEQNTTRATFTKVFSVTFASGRHWIRSGKEINMMLL